MEKQRVSVLCPIRYCRNQLEVSQICVAVLWVLCKLCKQQVPQLSCCKDCLWTLAAGTLTLFGQIQLMVLTWVRTSTGTLCVDDFCIKVVNLKKKTFSLWYFYYELRKIIWECVLRVMRWIKDIVGNLDLWVKNKVDNFDSLLGSEWELWCLWDR